MSYSTLSTEDKQLVDMSILCAAYDEIEFQSQPSKQGKAVLFAGISMPEHIGRYREDFAIALSDSNNQKNMTQIRSETLQNTIDILQEGKWPHLLELAQHLDQLPPNVRKIALAKANPVKTGQVK